jgi:hypothetical protein
MTTSLSDALADARRQADAFCSKAKTRAASTGPVAREEGMVLAMLAVQQELRGISLLIEAQWTPPFPNTS